MPRTTAEEAYRVLYPITNSVTEIYTSDSNETVKGFTVALFQACPLSIKLETTLIGEHLML